MVRNYFTRSAFTLLEVLFAIVIVGVTMVSVPVIINSNARGFDVTITQEAIFAASAELNQVLALSWDENSIQNNNTTATRVINPGDCNAATNRRPGHVGQPLHRRCLDNNAITPTLPINFGLDPGEIDADDIDDINQGQKLMFSDSTTTASGYKHSYRSDFDISYSGIDTVNTADRDAKLIEIVVRTDDGEVVTRLRSYTLNIGEVDYYSRPF